jgi:hypothetical protein
MIRAGKVEGAAAMFRHDLDHAKDIVTNPDIGPDLTPAQVQKLLARYAARRQAIADSLGIEAATMVRIPPAGQVGTWEPDPGELPTGG